RRRHTRFSRDWSSDVCSSDLSRARGLKRGEDLAVQQARLVASSRARGLKHGVACNGGRSVDVASSRARGLKRWSAGCRWAAPPRSEERRVGTDEKTQRHTHYG